MNTNQLSSPDISATHGKRPSGAAPPSADTTRFKRQRMILPTPQSDGASSFNPTGAIIIDGTRYRRSNGACEKCRQRKTRCDNQRPSCSYCSRRNLTCVYDDLDDANVVASNTVILEAISNLTQLVEEQKNELRRHSCGSYRQPIIASTEVIPVHAAPSLASGTHEILAEEPIPVVSTTQNKLQAQGAETVLAWDILSPYRTSECLFASTTQSYGDFEDISPPSLRYDEMLQLESRYIQGVHIKNPFLKLPDLRNSILHVAENGPDWSTRTCLVALVCAIGAATHPIRPAPSRDRLSGIDLSGSTISPEIRLSLQFWSIAVKRLGMAIGRNDIEAVQCLCLAGVWHMHLLQPIEAWRYFHLAGAAWHGLKLMEQTFAQHTDTRVLESKSLTDMQALHFTIWKSQCEILMELPLPSIELDDSSFPHGFPMPPDLNQNGTTIDTTDDDRTWWYYLAEIAARHLLNRIARTEHEVPQQLTSQYVRKMLQQADIMETQIHNWYLSLPSIFRFEIPTSLNIENYTDDWMLILRHRYLGLREYVGRPFVRLSVDYGLSEIEPALQARVRLLATQSVYYCTIKLLQAQPLRHQGTWFQMRQMLTYTLILSAVCFAKQKPDRPGAHAIALPEQWLPKVRCALESLESTVWREESGGLKAVYRLIQKVLAKCSEYGPPEMAFPAFGG